MPRASANNGSAGQFLQAWRGELPKVAASLTTALILFLASLTFAPVRQWLFGREVASYPLICTADPVAGPGGRRTVEFYVVNRSDKNFTGEELQRQLDDALRGSGSRASAGIRLPFDSVVGRIEQVRVDQAFNDSKGQLIATTNGRAVLIRIGDIHAGAILRVYIDLAGFPNLSPITRDAKGQVPFDYQTMQGACYTRL
jgi:hypothetical protein